MRFSDSLTFIKDTRRNEMTDRVLKLVGVLNARELGGLKTSDGKTIRRKVLLRTGKLQNATVETIDMLKNEYKLNTIMDMRMSFERESAPNPVIEGVRDIHIKIFDETAIMGKMRMPPITDGFLSNPDNLKYAIKFFEETGGDGTLYVNMVEDKMGQKGYGRYLELLAGNTAREGMLWHCSFGKDRTGIATAFILSLLGVSRGQILEDFLLTNETFADEIEESKLTLRKYLPDKEKADIYALMLKGAASIAMNNLLDHMENNYGSVEGFAREKLNVDDEMISTLKEIYTE